MAQPLYRRASLSTSAARLGGAERNRTLRGVHQERRLERDLPHLAGERHPREHPRADLLRAQPGLYGVLPRAGAVTTTSPARPSSTRPSSPTGGIFENISQIVDDIFNDYIVRQGRVEPLFAQFCDGVRTKCGGLSQWGSVDLAEEGMTPL